MVHFLMLYICVYIICTKFEVSAIILMSFRQGRGRGNFTPSLPITKQIPQKPTQIMVKEFICSKNVWLQHCPGQKLNQMQRLTLGESLSP